MSLMVTDPYRPSKTRGMPAESEIISDDYCRKEAPNVCEGDHFLSKNRRLEGLSCITALALPGHDYVEGDDLTSPETSPIATAW